MEEQRRLLINKADTTNSSEEEWSDSSSSSYYSDSESSEAEWESSVNDATGELLFIDCHPFVTQNNVECSKQKSVPAEPFRKDQLRRSTRGKFLRLIRRRESKRHSKRYQKAQEALETSTSNKVKFHDSQEGEEKEVILKVNNELYHKSAAGPLVEVLLGINVSTLSDGNRIMIAGFLPDSEAKHEKNIKIGDWLKGINNINVTYQTLNYALEKIIDKHDVLLNLQRVAGVEVTKDPPINELNSQSRFVHELVNSNTDNEQVLWEIFTRNSIAVLFLNTDNLSESSPEYEDVIYCYPRPITKCILSQSRGIFITLSHLINDITKTGPKISCLLHEDKLCHVTYSCFNNNLLLFMIPEYCVSIQEATLITEQIIRMFQFLYETVDNAFCKETNRSSLDTFFGRFFGRLLNNGIWTTSDNISSVQKQYSPKFESALPAAIMLTLPNEASMQVDDALSELEASDYREWNEEPLDCQRLFTILGSALYHDGYLLASHFIHEDLIDVHIYCHQQGLLHLTKTEPIKNMVLWKEVYPTSCKTANSNVKVPPGRRYLLVVGSRKNLLAVIMEAGGCTEPPEDNMGPDAFYVEEAQATLSHIQEMGVPELADRWILSNPGAQVTIPETNHKRRNDFIDALSRPLSQHSKDLKRPEVTSILKRRNSDQPLPNPAFFLAEDQSDAQSCSSQGGNSESNSKGKYDSNDEDSDDYADGSQMSNSSFDMSELRQTLLSETEDITPQQLTAGTENVLLHFVQFDSTEGVLICPPECRVESQTLNVILSYFRKCCHKIHSLFNNTMRFKDMPAQDMAKSVMNKSLIAIKEHGIMFECPFFDDTDAKKHKVKYWVIGRLFYTPHPKEVYVCYQDTIPQNIIELAFNIDLSTVN